jgi:hypothetical protein
MVETLAGVAVVVFMVWSFDRCDVANGLTKVIKVLTIPNIYLYFL